MIGPGAFAGLSAVVFACGLLGIGMRRNSFAALASLCVLLGAPAIALMGFTEVGQSGATTPTSGEAAAVLLIGAVCAEMILGAAITVFAWRRRDSVDLESLDELEA